MDEINNIEEASTEELLDYLIRIVAKNPSEEQDEEYTIKQEIIKRCGIKGAGYGKHL